MGFASRWRHVLPSGWIWLRSFWLTMRLSRRILKASSKKSPAGLENIAALTACQWAERLLKFSRTTVEIDGELPVQDEYTIYAVTHGSVFDFVVLPIFFQHTLPIFLLAKDHFLDHIFFRRILGMGEACRRLGMIFVERKRRNHQQAVVTSHRAAEVFLQHRGHRPLVIFPQGTRARPTWSAWGEILGASYYAVGNRERLLKEGGHLKKGIAHIALETARMLKKQKAQHRVNIVPLAIMGAAVIAPRKSFRIRRGGSIQLRTGEPVVVDTLQSPDELIKQIDKAIVGLLKLHGELEGRFLEEIRSRNNGNLFEEISVAFRQWRGDDPIVYVILDDIFALSPEVRSPFISQLIHLLTNHATREEFEELKKAVVLKLS